MRQYVLQDELGAPTLQKEVSVPMVHACRWQDCGSLTMGELCVHHEEQQKELSQRRLQRLLSATAFALVASVGAVATRVYLR